MKTVNIDFEDLKRWEERLQTVFLILDGQRRSGIWTLVCDEALRDLAAVRREIDWEVFDTVKETVR